MAENQKRPKEPPVRPFQPVNASTDVLVGSVRGPFELRYCIPARAGADRGLSTSFALRGSISECCPHDTHARSPWIAFSSMPHSVLIARRTVPARLATHTKTPEGTLITRCSLPMQAPAGSLDVRGPFGHAYRTRRAAGRERQLSTSFSVPRPLLRAISTGYPRGRCPDAPERRQRPPSPTPSRAATTCRRRGAACHRVPPGTARHRTASRYPTT